MPASKCHCSYILWQILTPLLTGYLFNLLSCMGCLIYTLCSLIWEIKTRRWLALCFSMSYRLKDNIKKHHHTGWTWSLLLAKCKNFRRLTRMIFSFRVWKVMRQNEGGLKWTLPCLWERRAEKARRKKWLMAGKSFKITCFWPDIFFFLEDNFIDIQFKYHIFHALAV